MRRFLLSGEGWPYLLVPFIPIAVVFEFAHVGAVPTFFTSTLGVIPTAALMGRATEELAARAGPGIGGLLNVTFGNAPELIIALFALGAGLHEVVKASLLGSILGNSLLVLGAAAFVGGLGRDRQHFDRSAASTQTHDADARRRRARDAGHLRPRRGLGPAEPGRRDRRLRLDGRVPVARGRRGAHPDLRRRPVVLAQDPPRPLQPAREGHGSAAGAEARRRGGRRRRSTASPGRPAGRSSRWPSPVSRSG